MAIMKILIVGTGRAGTSFADALDAASHHVTRTHHDQLPANVSEDLVLLCVPDDAITTVAHNLKVSGDTVVAHVAGSRGLEVLGDHERVGSLHPLVTMPDGVVGSARLKGAVYAVAGDPLLGDVVTSLQGRAITVPEGQRVLYHAAAVSAANHVVALMAHVDVIAQAAGLELRDFLPLAHQALEDVHARGPAGALTGPASRGDVVTLRDHLYAVPPDERATYVALANRALRLADAKVVPWNE
jgi:predicted short-subunit dehydrogenase-like oxidoreductase (DUF2520 family)